MAWGQLKRECDVVGQASYLLPSVDFHVVLKKLHRGSVVDDEGPSIMNYEL